LGPNPIGFEIKIAYPSLSNPFNIFQSLFDQNQNMQEFIQNVNFQDLIACLEILDQQKNMIRFLKSYPLFRENILQI
jgi:hypothetical protein